MAIELVRKELWDIGAHERSIEKLNIPEPPCKHCVHWNPQPKFAPDRNGTGQTFDGIVCCHAKDMYSDYSCFEKRENDEKI